jgi:hypothetical protein
LTGFRHAAATSVSIEATAANRDRDHDGHVTGTAAFGAIHYVSHDLFFLSGDYLVLYVLKHGYH